MHRLAGTGTGLENGMMYRMYAEMGVACSRAAVCCGLRHLEIVSFCELVGN